MTSPAKPRRAPAGTPAAAKKAAAAPAHAAHPAHPLVARPDSVALGKRLNRIEGQVRGIGRMIEEDRYCIDIMTQISAVRAALRRVEEEILHDHVSHCVQHAIDSGNTAEQKRKITELVETLSRTSR